VPQAEHCLWHFIHIKHLEPWITQQFHQKKTAPKPALEGYFEVLVQHAIKAPSSHNSQPWKFVAHPDAIEILPDFTRALPVVDPDHHALYLSLGCALENLLIAGAHFGFLGTPVFIRQKDGSTAINVTFTYLEGLESSPLFSYIPVRQSNRGNYDIQPIGREALEHLQVKMPDTGVSVSLYHGKPAMQPFETWIMEGIERQFRRKPFVNELVSWFRFSEREARTTGDGLWAACSGIPNTGKLIGRMIMKNFVSAKSEQKRWKGLLEHTSGLALFSVKHNTPEGWIDAGRAFQRFGLTATQLGIAHAHVNMPCEEVEVRNKMAQSLGLAGWHPLLLIRFGFAQGMPYSFRRDLAEVATFHLSG
jgi:hypothetical protein